jgi:flavin reductase (DIM6/NTAB) family NADH-FMN oxidoreductase RutF
MSAADFDRLLATTDPTMVIATAAVAGERAGCLVGFSAQCSIDPPRYVVFLSRTNRTFRVATGADRIAIHFLDDSHAELAELFGGETGDDVDKFARVGHAEVEGTPVLSACDRWFVGRVVGRLTPGDHDGFVLEPIAVSAGPGPSEEIGYQDVKDVDAGHPP